MSKVDVGALIKELSGQEPTPADVNRIEAIAHRMRIDNDDPYMPMLVVLEWYHGVYSRLPAEVAQGCTAAAKNAADTASTLAQTNMSNAVAKLVPTFEKKFSEAAAAAVERIQLGRSLLSIFVGMTTLGGFFLVGALLGAHVLDKLHDGDFNMAQASHELAWGTGLGIASPLLLIYFLLRSWEGARRLNWMEVVTGLLGIGGFVTLLLHQLASFGF
jgi:hypothetical protein